MANLAQTFQKLAAQTYQAGEPSDFVFGTVISESPLKIQVDQKLILTEEFVVLTSNVMDYKVKACMYAIGGSEGEKQYITIYNGLKTGDEVIMLKNQGGQRYVVLDKIVSEGVEK